VSGTKFDVEISHLGSRNVIHSAAMFLFRRAFHVGVPLLNTTLLGPQKAVTYNNGYSPEGLRVSLTQTSFPYIAGTWNISQKTAATYNNDHKPEIINIQ
jgi:hypothetical protein